MSQRPDYLTQFDHAVRIAAHDIGGDWDHKRMGVGLAVFQRNTRLFLAGDLVLLWFTNGGGERWPVYGRSSRGYDVRCLSQQGARHRIRGAWFAPTDEHFKKAHPFGLRWTKETRHYNKCTLRLVEVPDELPTEWLEVGPARLRRWLSEALRAGYAARGVGSGSPLPLRQGDPPRARRRQWTGPPVEY